MSQQQPGAITVRVGSERINVPSILAAELGLRMGQRITPETAALVAARIAEIVEVIAESRMTQQRKGH